MIYHLNESQYTRFWYNIELHGTYDTFEQIFHIKYEEHGKEGEDGYWGTIIGEEQYINFFLLQL